MSKRKYCPIRDLAGALWEAAEVQPASSDCIGPECAWWMSVEWEVGHGHAFRSAKQCGLIPRVAGRNDWRMEES